MSRDIKKEEVHSVKVYFIKPIDLINVVINTLVEMEYETYTIYEGEMERLLHILPEDQRSIVFVCIANRLDVVRSLEFIEKLRKMEKANIQIGAFAYASLDPTVKQKILFNLVSVTSFADLKENTLGVLKTILQAFDAKGNRSYIRVKTKGVSEVYITIKGRPDPVKAQIVDLSAFAFACEIDPAYHWYFEKGKFVSEILLSMKGIRIRAAAKLLGFSEQNKNIFIFRYIGMESKDGKMFYTPRVPLEIKQKIHRYISSCLKEEMSERLAKVQLPKPRKKTSGQPAENTPEEQTGTVTAEADEAEQAEPVEHQKPGSGVETQDSQSMEQQSAEESEPVGVEKKPVEPAEVSQSHPLATPPESSSKESPS